MEPLMSAHDLSQPPASKPSTADVAKFMLQREEALLATDLEHLRSDVNDLILSGGSASKLGEVASTLETVRRARTRVDVLKEALGLR